MSDFAIISITKVTLDTAVLDRLIGEAQQKAARIVETYGQQMAGEAAMTAPIKTGALRNSIASESKMTAPLTFTISDGVEYGVWNEFGSSKMAARPFIVPAVEHYAQQFLDAFQELFNG